MSKPNGQTSPTPIKVFISHAHGDHNVASKLIDFLLTEFDLREDEIRCTSALEAGHCIRPGLSVAEQLRDDLESASIVIGLLSAFGLESVWVKFEIGAAWGARKTLIPFIGPGFHGKRDQLGPLASALCFSVDDNNIERLLLSHFREEFALAGIGVKRDGHSLSKLTDVVETYRQFGGIGADFSNTEVKITSPQTGESIGGSIAVSFSVENMPQNGHLWFGILPKGKNGQFWPKEVNDGNERTVIFDEGDQNTPAKTIAIRVIGVGLAGHAFIQQWKAYGNSNNHWPGLSTETVLKDAPQIPGAKDLDVVEHVVLNNALFPNS